MQVVVIGLGQFGLSLTRSLAARGVEVLAVDRDPERVQEVASVATRAVAFDATDERELARIEPASRDTCVCGIGDEAIEASIIVTALLRQLGAPRIVARAANPLHERILRAVGAHEVVNPERDFGERLAARFVHRGLLDELRLGEDLVVSEIEVPALLDGRTLAELQLRRRMGLQVIALRPREGAHARLPRPDEPLRAGDVMVVVGRPEDVAELLRRA